MRKIYKTRIIDLNNEGFSTGELALMYQISEWQIKLILETSDEIN
jgi:hypothetical protein